MQVCQIGLTEGPQGPRWMFQRCLIPGHMTFSHMLWDAVHWSPSAQHLMAELWESRSQLTVAGDVSISVTVTRSCSG